MPNPTSQELRFAVLAIDTVVLTIIDNQLCILLIKAGTGPFEGTWALPGGLVKPEETLEQAVERHLATKANLSNVYVEQLYTFGRPDRDPRGRVVSVAYMALIDAHTVALKTSTDYLGIEWLPLHKLPKLAYDHNEIVAAALDRLKAKLEFTNIVYTLLPKEFTLTQLQQVYESILDKPLDKRNFRKKILSLDVIEKSPNKQTGEPNRPAQLYRFIARTPKTIDML